MAASRLLLRIDAGVTGFFILAGETAARKWPLMSRW
jgi:hypothetical protein